MSQILIHVLCINFPTFKIKSLTMKPWTVQILR